VRRPRQASSAATSCSRPPGYPGTAITPFPCSLHQRPALHCAQRCAKTARRTPLLRHAIADTRQLQVPCSRLLRSAQRLGAPLADTFLTRCTFQVAKPSGAVRPVSFFRFRQILVSTGLHQRCSAATDPHTHNPANLLFLYPPTPQPYPPSPTFTRRLWC
jgi:hypothetical protein